MKRLVLPLILSAALPLGMVHGPALADAAAKAERAFKKAQQQTAPALPQPPALPVVPDGFAKPTGIGQVSLDFASVEYFPNLKSKIGIASPLSIAGLELTLPEVAEIGPGLACNLLNFDHWIGADGTLPLPALAETYATPNDATTRPVATLNHPAPWLWSFSRGLGDLDVAHLIQLTGAPAQYQVAKAAEPATDPLPTDFAGTATWVGEWTAAANHPYPMLWSFWNEPGHTLEGVLQGRDAAGNPAFPDETTAQFASRDKDQRTKAVKDTLTLYGLYDQAIRPAAGSYSQLGLASMIGVDFNPLKLTASGHGFFEDVMTGLAPHPADFVSFNSFNGVFMTEVKGSRAILATQPLAGPVIFTQYAPSVLQRTGTGTDHAFIDQGAGLDHRAATQMLTDLAQMERATDVQNVCLSYWLGNRKSGLLVKVGTQITRLPRYHALDMFMQLPVLRTTLDFGTTGLAEAGLRGLAGVNGGRAAVLFWNQSEVPLQVPVSLAHLPKGATVAMGQLRVLGMEDDAPRPLPFDGTSVTVPAQGVALLSFDTGAGIDPLARRKALAPARFLRTQTFPDRGIAPCSPANGVKGISQCGAMSGDFGLYDAVRSVAYLGKGTGKGDPRLTASYEDLPPVVAVTPQIIGAGSVGLTATYATCGTTVVADLSQTPATLDASAVPASCRSGPVTLTVTLQGGATGSQAEVYLDADPKAARSIAASMPRLTLAPDLSVVEASAR